MRTHYLSQKNKKPWTLSQYHHSIESFIDLVQHDINDAKILNTKRPKDNLAKGEQKALEELSKRDDIIITNAVKGGAIIIMKHNASLMTKIITKHFEQIRLYNTTN